MFWSLGFDFGYWQINSQCDCRLHAKINQLFDINNFLCVLSKGLMDKESTKHFKVIIAVEFNSN